MDGLLSLGVFQSIPSDVLNVISDYSDFRLGLLSRPLRLSWEVDNNEIGTYSPCGKISGDDQFAMIIGSGKSQYTMQTFLKGKLHSTFSVPQLEDFVIHKCTIVAIHYAPDDDGNDVDDDEHYRSTGPFYYQILIYNIDNGELLRTFETKPEMCRCFNFTVDSDDNIVLQSCRHNGSRYESTYCLKRGILLRSETVYNTFFIRNEKDRFFSVSHDVGENPGYSHIQKHDITNVYKIVAKIPVRTFVQNCCWVQCCVPGHPEKLIISTLKPDRLGEIITLVDFDNPKIQNVIFETSRRSGRVLVGINGKMTISHRNHAWCFE